MGPDDAARETPSLEYRIRLAQWHLNRYDALRASTAGRAGAVLSAGAILSAGNAVILTEILTGARPGSQFLPATVISVAAVISTGLVVLSLFHASNVLVTRVGSRQAFDPDRVVPDAPFFNGPDTIDRLDSFDRFSAAFRAQSRAEIQAAAEVELWIGIQQHRKRYRELRRSVRDLRYAGLAFLVVLVGVIVVHLLAAR